MGAEREGSEEVLLYAGGRPLDMEMIATDLAEISLDVTVPLKGGKVHGSLLVPVRSEARPPRLTPRRKKKTGLAKRRIQYNRRLVNVVATFGRKKGPNSNSSSLFLNQRYVSYDLKAMKNTGRIHDS